MIKVGAKYKFNFKKWNENHPFDPLAIFESYEAEAIEIISDELFFGKECVPSGEDGYCGNYYSEYFDIIE